MRRLVHALAAILLAASASAQVGSVANATLLYKSSNPTGTCGARSMTWQTTSNHLWVCEGGVWVDGLAAAVTTFPITNSPGTTLTYSLDLQDTGSNDFLSFDNVATPAKTITFTQTSSAPSLATTVTNGTTTMATSLNNTDAPFFTYTSGIQSVNLLAEAAAQVGFTSNVNVSGGTSSSVYQRNDWLRFDLSGAVNTDIALQLQDLSSNDFLTFTNVATPAKTITFTQDSSVPQLSTTVTDGTTSVQNTHDMNAFQSSSTGASATVTEFSFELRNDVANYTFLSFTNVATPANSIIFAQDAAAPSFTTTVTDGTNTTTTVQNATDYSFSATDGTQTAAILHQPTSFTVDFTAATTTDVTLGLNDTATNDFLSFANVATPAKTITFRQNSALPRLTTTLTDGTKTNTLTQDVHSHEVELLGGAAWSGQFRIDSDTAINAIFDFDFGAALNSQFLHNTTGAALNLRSSDDNNSIDVQAGTNLDGFKVTTTGTKPTCSSAVRGNVWRTEGGAGADDTFEACLKDSSNAYAWRDLAVLTDSAPTAPSCTGLGTGSAALDTGSTNGAGIFVLSPTGAPGSSGTCTATFAGTLGTNRPVCVATAGNVAGSVWDIAVMRIATAISTTTLAIAWDNNGVSLTAGGTYRINYVCFGK